MLARLDYCGRVATMIFTKGHIAHTDTAANAVMSEVFAMQCQSFCASAAGVVSDAAIVSSLPDHFYYRYL